MTELLTVLTIATLATISPGPDFVVVTRNSLLHSHSVGMYTATGIALAVLIHVAYTILGIGYLISQSVLLFTILKTIGALYLIYIGIKMSWTKGKAIAPGGEKAVVQSLSPAKALRQGFICNVTNPKTTIFIVSIFVQLVSPATPLWQQLLYGLAIAFIHLIWFGILAFGFASMAKYPRFDKLKSGFEKVAGVVMIGLGLKLLLSGNR